MEKSTKIWLIVSGLLFIVLGILCFCFPAEALFTTAWMIGCFTLFAGVSRLVFTIRTQAFLPNSGTRMLSALLQIVIGIFFLCNNIFVSMSLPLVFAVWVIVEGISVAVQSFDYKRFGFGNWWVLFILGIAAAVLGCFGLKYYDIAGRTLSILIGLSVIAVGIAYLCAYTGIHRLEKGVEEFRKSFRQ